MQRSLLVKIDGTAEHCHGAKIPPGTGPCGDGDYPTGTCPYYRQFPNGSDPECLLFHTKPHVNTPLRRTEDGFALRAPACLSAAQKSWEEKHVLIHITAAQRTCETTPIIDAPMVHPWISAGNGSPTVYRSHQVCPYYVTFQGGTSHCRLIGSGEVLSRSSKGLTRRLSICIKAEANAKLEEA